MDGGTLLVQWVISGLSLGGLYALMALGLSLVYSILRLVNFAYGELIMVAGYTLFLLNPTPIPFLIVVCIAIALAAITSMMTERVAFRPVRSADPNTGLITSFALSALLQNAALLFISPRPQGVPMPALFTDNVRIGAVFFAQRDLISLVVSLILLGLLVAFLTRTKLGIGLRAAADDFTMASLLGVNANRIIAVAFALSGLLAGAVAIFWVGRVGTVTADVGTTPVLVAFVAIVIGGMGSLTGAAVGGFLLGFLNVGLQFVLPSDLLVFRQAFLFGIVILVLLFRPGGLIASGRTVDRV